MADLEPGLPLDEIVGRREEVDALDRLVDEARLVTITGLGGLGKTRLARELVRRQRALGRDAALIDLTAVLRADLVPARVAAEFGLEDDFAEPPEATVIRFLADRPFLLALDSFEHLLAAAPFVRALLASSPQLSVLVTSRFALRIAGEREFPLGPLAAPADDRWETVSASPAGRLFIREAERIGSAIGPADAPAVADICRLLGGVPLGLELAAARTRVFSTAILADRLAHDLPTLPRSETGADDALSAVIGWTVEVLPEADRARFLSLAVLPGTFGLAAATALWDAADPLALLDATLRLGLVRRATGGIDHDRFELLAPVRDYARRHLHLDDGEPEAMRRLTDHVLRLALDIGATLRGSAQVEGMATIRRELDTLRLVIDRTSVVDPLVAARIVVALETYWTRTGLREGRALALALIGRPRIDDVLAGQLLDIVALVEISLIGPDPAIEHATMMLDIARRTGDARTEMRARFNLGLAYGQREEVAASVEELRRAAALADQLGDPAEATRILGNLGVIHEERGALDEAATALREAATQARLSGDDFAIAVNLSNLAEVLLFSGRGNEGAPIAAEAARIFAALGPSRFATSNALIRAGIAAAAGDVASASALVSDGARDIDVAGAWEDLAILFEFAAMLRLAQERPRDAARLIGAASRLRSKSGPPSEPGHYIAQRDTMAHIERKLGSARLAAALADGRSAEVADLVRDLSSILPSNPALRGRYGRLSAREVEVLRLVVDGATDPEIAEHLTISPKTASVHVSNLRTKLDATSRIGLAMSGRLLLDAAEPAPRE